MQDSPSSAADCGRFFAGGLGDRRLRPHNHSHHQEPLKCPRCDSLNTKFCYYNNYNLSQPRHFCKNCRRYWTSGGVLRNVPVGGGCRKSKSKRSKKISSNCSSSSLEISPEITTTPPQPEFPEGNLNNLNNSNSNCSSESSSLTATTEAVSPATSNAALSNKNVILDENGSNPNFNGGGGYYGGFSDVGTFTSLMSSANETVSFGFENNVNVLDTTSFRFGSDGGGGEWMQQQKVMGIGSGASEPLMLDQTVPVELSSLQNGKVSNGECGPLDCDHGLFDLTSAVDQAYWSHTYWSDQDPNLNLFP
ncbi:hypothetical protein PIB30_002163 [Stylosanthes scabra]|uniref:Dof zinc finger protein n=1 Tax=Stylosanthes scabra TaxID=79078 RepID=A0ABU6S2T2_9FABA|nr:hypothetical protein [Stylosanthes scabra]